MIKQLCITLLLTATVTQQASAHRFRPTLSLIANRTFTHNYTYVNAGLFDISNRKVNFGLELTEQFNLGHHYFIRPGLRYGGYKNYISGRNQMPDLIDDAYPVYWERNHKSYSLLLQTGKEFVTKKGRHADVFMGVSAGVLTTASIKAGVRSLNSNNPNFTDTISVQVTQSGDLTPSYFMSTVDFGINYHPFKKAQKFSIGAQCTIQLNKAGSYEYKGTVTNISKYTFYDYDLRHETSVINVAFAVRYRFGKDRRATKG